MEGVCPSCGNRNPVSGKFCGECGASLAPSCPKCNSPVVAGQKFCVECGAALTSESTAPATAAAISVPSAERRICSVLFADLVGFTPFAESRDPEAIRELLSQYFEIAGTVIVRYGGVVEKFIGDAVMAVWGTPVATEGDAERAVRAGLDLVAAVAALGAEVGADGLGLRVGVVTGGVAVTLGAVGQGMVAGDAVNTAARVQSTAGPGQVWVDEPTRRLTGAAIGFTAEGEHSLKGKAEPVALFRATRVLARVGGGQRVDGLEAPLIGRDAELRTVKELFHATVDRKSPRLVVVSGPPGVGKSRLGWEFEKYIDGLAEVTWWHRGRCLSYGEGVAYWALAEMVRQRFGIAEEDPLDVAAGKLTELLPKFVPDPGEQAYVGPRLARLLGVPHPGGSETPPGREELFAGWRLFFERLAATGPVVLLFEDAQHADAALLDFLDHLVDWARTSPIFVVIFGRTELLEQRPGWGVGRNRTLLTLDVLDDRSLDDLVEALVPGMPSDAVAAIARQSQGNPLFAIETIRSLIDRDVVVPRDGRYTLVGDVGSLKVPDSLHGLLAARLDAFDPKVRALVADAAVLGTTFPAEALIAVSGQPASDVNSALDELVRREVLEISADPLSPQRGSYRFAQNMLRQVAYATLSRRDRKARHLAVAAHLRSTFEGDEIMEVVARHYLDALTAVDDDPDVNDIRSKAIEALLRAGERALTSGAPARAAQDFATAADLTSGTSDGDRQLAAAGLWERAAAAARTAADFPNVRAHADRAQAIYAERGRERDAARAQAQAGAGEFYLGHTARARDLLIRAAEVLRPDPDVDTVTALRDLAALEIFSGDPRGDAMAEEALVLGQELELADDKLGELFTVRALGYQRANQPARAIAHYKYGEALAERAGDSMVRVRSLTNLAGAALLSEPAVAAEAGREAYELGRRVGARGFMATALSNLAFALILLGDWDRAAEALTVGIETDGFAGDPFAEGTLAALAALRGDLAAATVHGALPSCRQSEEPQARSEALLVDALMAGAAGHDADALAFAQEVVALEQALSLTHELYCFAWSTAVRAAFELGDLAAIEELVARLDAHPIGHIPSLLRAERGLARARLRAARRADDADAALAAAVLQLRAAGSPYHLAHALLDQAQYRVETGIDDAEPLLAEAGAIAGSLRAQPLAARADLLRAARSAAPAEPAPAG